MSQPPASGSTSQTPAASPSSSDIEGIFQTALESYKKKTKQDLRSHDLFRQLEKCDSPGAILATFQADQFGPSRTGGDGGSKKWFVSTINVLYAFSATLGEGVGLVFSPAKVVFAGVGVLLLAARDVAASQDFLADIFGRIDKFFSRLEIYTGVPLIPALTDKLVEITVEVLDILATATKEMKQSRAKKFVKKLAGRTDVEDGLKKLDRLIREEVALASAHLVRIGHIINNNVTGVGDGVRGIDGKVQDVVAQVEDVKCDVQVVSNQIEVVDKRVQVIVDDGKEVMATVTEAKFIAQQTADNVEDVIQNELRESLRIWQSPPDPSTSHNLSSDRQHEGTAKWFIEDDKFGEWKVTGSLLWIHGKPGSGKSVLCSAIINDITALCKDGSASMAYFYFDFRDTNKRDRRNLLSSLLTQLSNSSDQFCEILSRLHKAHGNGARQPSDSALMQCLKEMLTLPNQGPLYLIVDALDECPDTSDVPSAREKVLDLVKDLVGLRSPSLHICVTSRPEVDISDALESLASQTVCLQDEKGQRQDIGDYVRSVVYSGSGKFMKKWRHEDKEHVIETLSERADGMFRWVFCQLETLRNCLPQNVRRVLTELPRSLDETYERILKEVGKVNSHQAYRLLQCLTVATRPLRVEELAEVLALNFDEAKNGIPPLNKDWRWDDQHQGVLSTCSSLIVIVDVNDFNEHGLSNGRVVQFAHFSVKEFLTSDRLSNMEPDISRFHIRPEPAHTVIAQACLAILLQSDYTDRVNSSSPLHEYAARNWVDHVQFENVSLHVEDAMRCLFNPAKPYFAGWLDSYDIDKPWRPFTSNGTTARFSTLLPKLPRSFEDYAALCLYYASLCGFSDLTKYLVAEYPQHVNARVGFNKSPLVAALRNRHWEVAELLHRNGAAVDVTNHRNLTPLHAALKEGIVDVARWLLDHGASANSRRSDDLTPLHMAASIGHPELVQTLLEHGVDVNATTSDNRTPLHAASKGGHIDIVRLLIRRGADANTHLHELFILASSSGSVDTVQFFIELGADVNARDELNKTPLHLASSTGNAETVRLLIGHGADVNAQSSRWQVYWTPLHLASSRRDAETVELLLQHGAYVNASGAEEKTPLHSALSLNYWRRMSSLEQKVIQLLVQHGADVNAQDKSNSTPLHLASSSWNAETVQLLIKHGADVNAQNGSHSTPLHLASSTGNAETVPLLTGCGADVNALDGVRSTPLHLASSTGNAETVRILIEHGADVSAHDGNHSMPLHLASSTGNAETVRILIEHGADVSAQDGNHTMPLHLASSMGNAETVRILIEHGADLLTDHGANVNAWDGSQRTPLHLMLSPDDSGWMSSSDQRVVQLLLRLGADVNALDGSHSTPLHLASSSWNNETVQLLIERGSDVNAQDGSHSTPLHLASSRGNTETVQLLIEHGADVNAWDGSHKTPLHSTLSPNNGRWMTSLDQKVTQLLIEHGADVNAQDGNRSTPLHLASSTGNVESVRLLIGHGANVNIQDQGDSTPLHLAWNTEIVSLFLQHGADFNAKDGNHSTPLHLASFWGNAETVRLLIQHGADVNAYDRSHLTPLHLALASQVPVAAVVRLLLEHGANLDVEDDIGRTPFQIASSREQYEIVRLFSDYCANIE